MYFTEGVIDSIRQTGSLRYVDWLIMVFTGSFQRGDPGFQEGLATPNFPENCMTLKKIGPIGGGGLASKVLLCRSATGFSKGKVASSAMHQKIFDFMEFFRIIGKM